MTNLQGQLLSDFECDCEGNPKTTCDCTGAVICQVCSRIICCKNKDKVVFQNGPVLCPLCQDEKIGTRKYDVLESKCIN